MKKQFLTSIASAAIIASALAAPSIASAGWEANVAMTTDYRFRGIAQTDEAFAIQGGFDYSHDNGFYAGVWGSNVDFQVQTVDDATAELDLYAGWGGEFNNGLGWDVGILRYAYPNADGSLNYDFTEVYGGLSYKWFSVSYAHSGDYFGGSDGADYFSVAADFELDGGWGVGASAGHQSVKDNATWGTPDWSDWKAYVSKDVGGFGVELAYTDTNLSKTECFGGSDWCDGQLILSVSKSFE